MKKSIIGIPFIMALLAMSNIGIPASNKFNFDYDYCVFRNDDSRLFMEFYYSFYQNQLVFLKTTGGYEADGKLDLKIIDTKSNDTIIKRDFKIPLKVEDTAGYNKLSKLTGQLDIVLDSGTYRFIVLASDFNKPEDSVGIEENFTFNRFEVDKVTSSSLQLASIITKSDDAKSIFYKNTFEVVPNPVRLYGNNLSNLYYYIEFYNLNTLDNSKNYYIDARITNLNGVVLKSDVKSFQVKHESKVYYGDFNISDLKTGIYKLQLVLKDDQSKEFVDKQKKFVVYNTDTSLASDFSAQGKYLLSEYPNYTEEQVEKEFDESSYIMSDVFKNRFKDINDLETKRRFLYEFWKNQQVNPFSQKNETKAEYFKRVAYANQNFKTEGREGWTTDRGRVYIVYGPPDDAERHPFEASTRAYEIWVYNSLQGGVEFDFIDISNGFGDYILANSTARDELSDSNWQDRLTVRR
jgi:GWxTD domain-containing protein